MKIKHFISASCFALTALALASCTSNDEITNGEENATSKVQENYINISISGNSETTRAYPGTNDYSTGTANETTINSVRFYFFDDAGNAVNVKAPAFDKNYYSMKKVGGTWKYFATEDATGAGVDQATEGPGVTVEDNTTVSNVVNATIVISTKDGDRIPARMVAVCNYEEAELGETSLSLSDLRSKIYLGTKKTGATKPRFDNVAEEASAIGPGQFVMTNSNYVDATGEVTSTNIPATSICGTKELALQHPVNIYVERVVAKVKADVQTTEGFTPVTITNTLNNEETVYYTKRFLHDTGTGSYEIKKDDGTTTFDPSVDEKIYIRLLGWNVTDVTDQANLFKNINPTWTEGLLSATEPWNVAAYHRSFWEITAASATVKHANFTGATLNTQFSGDGASPRYVLANAGTNSGTGADLGASMPINGDRTKVIIGAQLVNDKGETFYMSSWLGQTYIATTEEASELNLKTAMAEVLKQYLWREDVDSENRPIMRTIMPKDIKLNTRTEAAASVPTSENRRYTVWATVADPDVVWYKSGAKEEANKFTYKPAGSATTYTGTDAVNRYMAELLPAKVWNAGRTYYYFNIKHLGSKEGVVRNHVYQWGINSLVGLGTPVFNPDEEIIPEKTEDQDSYIAAKINVLAWRIVKQDATLAW